MTHEEAATEQQVDAIGDPIVLSWRDACYEKAIVIDDLKYKVSNSEIDSDGFVKKGAIVQGLTYYQIFETKKGKEKPPILKNPPKEHWSVSNVKLHLKQAIAERAKSFKQNTGKTYDHHEPQPSGLNESGRTHWKFIDQLSYFADYLSKTY
ncbi:uncharacterized protein [Oscarella lobularis]|uniref:uncharacterized protein n=1 Tax=Oscarella lobularis TaxID=121494 RepID=UPI003313B432